MKESLLEIRDLTVNRITEAGPVRILNGIDLAIDRGETLGIVGESGSGKTVLLRALLNLLDPPWDVCRGEVLFRGKDLLTMPEDELQAIRGKEIALTVANPRSHLNPLAPVGQQIANAIQAHSKLSRKEAMAKTVELLTQVGIADPTTRFSTYPHELSGGMAQRVIIAMALANSPKLLLADEPIFGLDVTIQIQILDLMLQLVRDFNSALVIVSRDLAVVAHYCRRTAVLYAGQIVEAGDSETFFERQIHPYSGHLFRAAVAARDASRDVRSSVGVRVERTETSCAYAPYCLVAIDRCCEQMPVLEPCEGERLVRCFRKEEIMAGEV